MPEQQDQSDGPMFFRILRNYLPHLTLEQKPKQFDVLLQQYRQCGAEPMSGPGGAGQQELVPWGEPCACNLKDALPADLTRLAALWTLEDINITPPDRSDAGLLLVQMAESKAWHSKVARVSSSNCSAFYIPRHVSDSDPAVAQLLQDGMIVESKSNPQHYFITVKGSQKLQMRLVFGSRQSLDDYHKFLGYSFCCFFLHENVGKCWFLVSWKLEMLDIGSSVACVLGLMCLSTFSMETFDSMTFMQPASQS